MAQSLGFEFSVWHAHRALWGLRLDLQVSSVALPRPLLDKYSQTLPDMFSDKLDPIYDAALAHVRASRLTDAELIYTPSQIALASLALVSPVLAEKWVASKGHSELACAIIPRIQNLIIQEGVGPHVEVVREVDRRLRICKNPEKVKGSKAWLKKEKEAEEAAKEKRTRKAEEARRAMVDDPFGGHLIEEVDPDGSIKVIGTAEPQIELDEDDDDS